MSVPARVCATCIPCLFQHVYAPHVFPVCSSTCMRHMYSLSIPARVCTTYTPCLFRQVHIPHTFPIYSITCMHHIIIFLDYAGKCMDHIHSLSISARVYTTVIPCLFRQVYIPHTFSVYSSICIYVPQTVHVYSRMCIYHIRSQPIIIYHCPS